jgi:hypothetical protein
MAKAKRYDYAVYPSTPNIRVGCKVGWRYYDRMIDAKRCAEAAKKNAAIQMAQGYDFGYCMPGSIRKVPTDADDVANDYAGKFEVCIP